MFVSNNSSDGCWSIGTGVVHNSCMTTVAIYKEQIHIIIQVHYTGQVVDLAFIQTIQLFFHNAAIVTDEIEASKLLISKHRFYVFSLSILCIWPATMPLVLCGSYEVSTLLCTNNLQLTSKQKYKWLICTTTSIYQTYIVLLIESKKHNIALFSNSP